MVLRLSTQSTEKQMFGAQLLKLLQTKHMTQNEISKATKIDEANISRFLTGEKVPSYHHILCISDAVGVDPVVFFPTAKHALEREGNCKRCHHKVEFVNHRYGTVYAVSIDSFNQIGMYRNLYVEDSARLPISVTVGHYDKDSSHIILRCIKGQVTIFYSFGKRVLNVGDAYRVKGYETHIQSKAGTVCDSIIMGTGYDKYMEIASAICA